MNDPAASYGVSIGGKHLSRNSKLRGIRPTYRFKFPDRPGTQLSCSAVISWLNRKPNPLKPHYPHGLGIMFAKLPEAVHKAILQISDKKTSS